MASYLDRQLDAAIKLHQDARAAEAEAAYRKVLQQQPNHPDAVHFLGLLLHQMGRGDEGLELLRQSIKLAPRAAPFHYNLGNALREQKRNDEAVAALRQALALDPRLADAWLQLANVLRGQGKLDETLDVLRRASNEPNSAAHSSLLYTLWLHPRYTPQEVFAEHRRWASLYADPLLPRNQVFPNEKNPEKRLRIGYVSQDFWRHVLGRYIEPILAHHDRNRFEIFGYSDSRHDDSVTAKIRSHCDQWRITRGLPHEQMADLIRQDRIDVLVDLAAHSGVNRSTVFAYKPAPIQVTYLGYPATTGMLAMDYRITDRRLDPPGMTEALHTEKLVPLPNCYWCFPRPEAPPPVNKLPALTNGFVTFAAYNSLAKMNPAGMRLWAEILNRMPRSRLRVLVPGGANNNAHIPRFFTDNGISIEQLVLRPELAYEHYLLEYHEADLSLDTLPNNGGATGLDSLFMGVPIVTVAGNSAVSRAGITLLSNVGLDELIAATPEQYIDKAVALASDVPRLAELRATLRSRMLRSPLTDVAALTQHLEIAYRQMWATWCAGQPPASFQIPNPAPA